MTTPDTRPDGWLRKGLNATDRFLGSPTLCLLAFAILAQKFVRDAGYQFDEFALVMIVYISLSHKLETIYDRLPAPPKGGESNG